MKISILTPNMSDNSVGRAYILAKVLKRHYDVEIAGPMLGDRLWYPVADDTSIKYKGIKVGREKTGLRLRQLMKAIEGDVIYASKPLMASFGLGLIKKVTGRKPLVLDIDDWETGLSKDFYVQLSFYGKVKNFIASFHNYYNYWNIRFFEKLTPLADGLTVANPFLQSRFGGVIVPHGRDTDLLDPERFDRDALRRGLGLENRKVIAYIGTPRRHKGVDDLIEAVSMIRNKDAMLLFVGITDRSRELCALAEQKLGRERFLALGEQPMARIGDFLAASDIVVIPQKESFGSIGQTPAKIFDAMAMAKPVLSTAVSDIPQVLEGCGIVTEPGNVKMMADKIDFLLENKEQALTLGKKARERCIEKYSWNAMDQRLFPLFEKYAKKMNR